MRKRARTWLSGFGEVLRAMIADPVQLAPALIIIGLAMLAAYLAWRVV